MMSVKSAGAERPRVVLIDAPGAQFEILDRVDDLGIVPERHSRPFVHDCRANSDRHSRRCGRSRRDSPSPDRSPSQFWSSPTFVTATKSPDRAMKRLARNDVFDRRASVLNMKIGVEHLFPHRKQEAQLALLARVLLRHLELERLVRVLQRADQRRNRLANLEVDWAFLDLDQHVVIELPVELREVIVSGPRTVVLQIAPVHVMVVDEAAINQHAAVGLERAGDDVRGIRVSTSVRGRTDAAFRVSFQNDAAEIGNGLVDLVYFALPPFGDFRVDRVERIEMAQDLWAAEVHRDREPDAPRTERIGNSGELRQKLGEIAFGLALTLLTVQPLMPIDASNRA